MTYLELAAPHSTDNEPKGARDDAVLAFGGGATALGSLGVVATSAFYALSPPAAALPGPFDQTQALAGAIAGAATLHAAGAIGVFSDLVLTIGAGLVGLEAVRRGRAVAAAGWIAIALAAVIFTFVDAIGGFVLSPLAVAKEASAFIGFKLLFNTLFLLGTIAFGAGAAAAMASETRSRPPLVGPRLAVAAALIGLFGIVAASACFFGASFELALGASIGLGAVAFTFVGAQVAQRAA